MSIHKINAADEKTIIAQKEIIFEQVYTAMRKQPEAKKFTDLCRKVGLHYPLRAYGNAKSAQDIKGKKAQSYLDKIPLGQDITVFVPVDPAMDDLSSEVKAAFDSKDKKRISAVRKKMKNILDSHVVKGSYLEEKLPTELQSIAGTKIKTSDLSIKRFLKAKNGVVFLIEKALAIGDMQLAKKDDTKKDNAGDNAENGKDS